MFDMISYILGNKDGKGNTTVSSDMTFVDDGEGNVSVVTEVEEVENNG